ncbi:hypothetical protein [Streptomyces sp. JW3]|uniref:hypothetical protein n=1 Tax=Streptomyces sp. JW3 TaxID=3456955 RepID=UPI003FA485BE
MEQDSTAGHGDELEHYGPTGGILVHTRAVRDFAASTWLLMAAPDIQQAREEWAAHGVALLRCGTLFTVVRDPLVLIEAAAGTEDRQQIGEYLSQALLGGPAFLDQTAHSVYFLVPGSTGRTWRVPDTDIAGADTYIGVPVPGVQPDGRRYWLVEMDGPGMLCSPSAVMQLVMHARYRAVAGGRGGA